MNKTLIRITESDLHRIVRESVNKILREGLINEVNWHEPKWQYMLGRLGARQNRNVAPNQAHNMEANGTSTYLHALNKAGRGLNGNGSYDPTDAFQKGVEMQNRYMNAQEDNDQEETQHFRKQINKHYNNFANQ